MAELDTRLSQDEYADWITFYRYEAWVQAHAADVARAGLGGQA